MVEMTIYTQKCEQKWLKINDRGGEGVGIKISWVEKKSKISNRGGGGTIIRDLRVIFIYSTLCLNIKHVGW